MRVLVVDQFGKTTGRETLALAELIKKNSDIDMHVFLADTTEIPTDRIYSVKIVRGFHGAYVGNAFNKVVNYLKALRKLYQYICEHEIDLVHLQWFSLPWIEWWYVKKLSKKCKVVITVHDVIPFDNRLFEMKFLNKIYTQADQLLVHTQSSKDLFFHIYNAMTPISVITQGYCLKSDHVRLDREIAKEHFDIPRDAVVFLYYGTIRPSKGLDVLIRAIHLAHDRNKRVYLLAAGAFHKVNKDEMKALVKSELKEEYSVVNFGFVPQKEEQWYFSAADVLCLPYREITQSGVAQLGLMYELPIIATDVGEMNDVCRNGENGILVEMGSVEKLAKAIVEMASDDRYRKEASIISKELGEGEFSLNRKANYVFDAYKKIMIT